MIRLNVGALELKKMSPNLFYSIYLYSIYFLECVGQFLQPPACDYKQTEPSLARSLYDTNVTLAFEDAQIIPPFFKEETDDTDDTDDRNDRGSL